VLDLRRRDGIRFVGHYEKTILNLIFLILRLRFSNFSLSEKKLCA
jgi:hypothetical protein